MSVQFVEQVMAPMRDGTRLATDVYLPDHSGGPWPALLLRTPYGSGPESAAQQFAAGGYAVVNQDVRGRYRSEGDFDAEREGTDGYDTVAWVRAQPWCNGKVGLYGPSYLAWTRFAAARQRPPGVSCLFVTVGDHARPQSAQSEQPHHADAPDHIAVPTCLVGGWFDRLLAGTIASYQALVANAPDKRAARAHRLIIGPWGQSPHAAPSGASGAGADTDLDLRDVQRRWFDHWLRQPDPDFDLEPPLRYYTMGANAWRTCCKWPPGGVTSTPYYLHGPADRATHRANAHGTLSHRSPTWDPPQRCTDDPHRPAPGEAGDDALSFTGEPLTAPLEVTGPVQAVLYAASSAPDTDCTVTLLDVQPDGRMLTICAGVAGARPHDAGSGNSAPLQPERVYRFAVDLLSTSYLFRPGHRLRVDISSGNCPQQTIYHDALRPSHILLPII